MSDSQKATEQAVTPVIPTAEPLPKEIEPIAKKMRRAVERLEAHVLSTQYELGKLVLEAVKRYRRSSRHRLGLMEWLAAYLGMNERTLYHCLDLVKRIPEDQYRRLIKPPMRWSHIRVILNHQLDTNLEHWVHRIIAENLTADALEQEVRRGLPSLRPGSGRRLAVPKTFRSGLAKFATVAGEFNKKIKRVYFSDDFHLAAVVHDTPPDEMDDEMRHAYFELIATQEQIAHSLAENAGQMRESLRWIDQVLEQRRKQQSQIAQPQVADNRPARFPNVGDRRGGASEAVAAHS